MWVGEMPILLAKMARRSGFYPPQNVGRPPSNLIMAEQNIIYARVSTEEQDVQQQKETLYDYATDSLSLDPASLVVLEDEESGRTTEREGYQEMLRRVRMGEVENVVCRSLSRIGRNMRDIHNTVYEIVEENDVGLHVQKESVSIDAGGEMDIGDKALINAMSLAAEIEADLIRERAIDGLRAARAAGKCTHRPPYGFTTDENGYLQPDEEFRRAVQAILAVEDLDWSQRRAARHTGVPRRTIPQLLDRKEMYLAEFDEGESDVLSDLAGDCG